MAFPYLDRSGFRAKTLIRPADLDDFVQKNPRYVEESIEDRQNEINARLAKRYGLGARGNGLPFGQSPPPLDASGTLPPAVALVGRPTIGSVRIRITITTPGSLGLAAFAWSLDGGVTIVADGVVTSATPVPLGSTGLSAVFGPGNYGMDNVYAAPSPVPNAVIRWLVWLVTADVYARRGPTRDTDATVAAVKDRHDQALAELKEAANSQESLFDLPPNDDGGASETTAGPLVYSEASPFVCADMMSDWGRQDDLARTGFSGG